MESKNFKLGEIAKRAAELREEGRCRRDTIVTEELFRIIEEAGLDWRQVAINSRWIIRITDQDLERQAAIYKNFKKRRWP